MNTDLNQELLSFVRIDENKIKDLISLDPSKDFFKQLMQIFVSEMQKGSISLQNDYEQNKLIETSKTAHRLRSTSLNLGAVRLGEVFRRIEYFKLDNDLANQKELEILIQIVQKESLIAKELLSTFAE